MKKVRFLILLFIMLLGCSFRQTTVYAAKIELNKTSASLLESKKMKLELKNATRTIEWKSSNSQVAKVSSKGIITGIAPGKCTITATHRNKSYKCELTVKSKRPIVLAGCSTIDYWKKTNTLFSPYSVVNMGIAGSRINAWKNKLYKPLIIDNDPLAVVLYIGSNDITPNTKESGEKIGKDITQLISKLHEELPDVPIYFVSIDPSPRRVKAWPRVQICNKYVKEYCRKTSNVYYLDTASHLRKNGKPIASLYAADNLHLNSKGYKVFEKVIVDAVLKGLQHE